METALPVIAMASELGTSGTEVASRVATRLSIELVDHNTLLKRVEERGYSIHSLLLDNASSRLETLVYNCETAAIGKQIASELQGLAQQGDVLIHSFIAPYILANVDYVPLVLVCASRTKRLKRILADQDSADTMAAVGMLKHHTTWRDKVLSSYFGIAPNHRALKYDLVADVGWLSCAEWTEEIVDLARDDEFAPDQFSLSKLNSPNATLKHPDSYVPPRQNYCGEL